MLRLFGWFGRWRVSGLCLLHGTLRRSFRLQVVLKEAGHGHEDAGKGGWGEPVAFTREDLGAVGYVEGGQALRQRLCVGGWDDVVVGAVEDEGGGEVWRGLRRVGLYEASGDLDESAEAEAFHGVGAGRDLSREGQAEERAQGDAGEDDTLRVDTGALGGEANGFVAGGEPLRGMGAVADGGEVGAEGTCAVKIVRGV